MAGHSRWHNIKHRKAISDAKRGKAWSKCVKAIMVAARTGGGDPATNLSLRYAIDDARYENVPRDTIDRAIKKGSGEIGDETWESVRYEGYGPAGVAVVVEALTNNRTRTAADVRLIFSDHECRLGTTGCVSHQFEHKGRILIDLGATPGQTGDALFEAAVSAGADDVQPEEGQAGIWVVLTQPTDFHAVRSALEAAKFGVKEARLELLPTTTVLVSGDDARSVVEFIEALEDNDDVQKVFANFDVPESELKSLG